MSQYSELKIIICVKIFFALFNTIESHNPMLITFHPEDNEDFHETIDESDEVDNVSSMDFLSNIHTIMTPNELYHTFGTNDGLLDYKVFPINLQQSRKKRQTNDNIKLTVEIDDRIIDLNLIATDGHLATKNTPVWLAHTDSKAYKKIRYDPYPEAMRYIEKFQMYQDLKNEAAIAVFTDSELNSTMEGIVTSRYAIKSLPKRLSLEIITKTSKYFVKSPIFRKRSIKPDVDEITGHFVVYEIKQKFKHSPLIKSMFKSRTKRQSPIGGKRKIPETVYPEILLVVEHDLIRHQTITEALQFLLAFWNGVDMVYSALNKPKISFHIAGIIISADDKATPYIARDTSLNVIAYASDLPETIGKYFYQEKDRFPANQYDIIIAMTTMRLCHDEIKPCEISLGYATFDNSCTQQYQIRKSVSIESVGVVYYNGMFGGVDTTVHEIAHLFGVPHDISVGLSSKCDQYVMAPSAKISVNNFKWSKCSKKSFKRYFSFKTSQCFDNKPESNKAYETILPGRWLTLDGQCQNFGFNKTCQVTDDLLCIVQGCKANGSETCVESVLSPLPGSKCGVNKHCDAIESQCVSD